MAVGVAGLFLEVHPDPEIVLCDGPNMVPLIRLEAFSANFVQIIMLWPMALLLAQCEIRITMASLSGLHQRSRLR